MAKKEKKGKGEEAPVALAARIGGPFGPDARAPAPPAPPPAREPDPLPPRLDGPLPPRRAIEPRESRPTSIGGDEHPPPPVVIPTDTAVDAKSSAIPSPRTPPGPRQTDPLITPPPPPDALPPFALALRK